MAEGRFQLDEARLVAFLKESLPDFDVSEGVEATMFTHGVTMRGGAV